MKLNILSLRKSINKAFLKVKPNRTHIENFKKNFLNLYDQINEAESEEFHKNIISTFLRETWYSPNHYINTKGRTDLVIHNGKDAESTVGVLLETKKPSNKTEMPTKENINSKAIHELILYYLRERITGKNIELKHLVVTNIYEWFIFNASDFERLFAQNTKLLKQFTDFEEGRLADTKTDFFYKQVAEPFLNELEAEISFVHADIRNYEKIFRNTNKQDDNKLVAFFKLFSPEHLLKLPFANDSNTLDKRFYTELLHIIGLQETKEGSKKLIGRKAENVRNTGSLIENAITILKYEDCLSQIKKGDYGTGDDEQLYNVALELVITWINRILFLKLLEGQLVKYHSGENSFQFLNSERIADYDELNKLFFQVLAIKENERSEGNKKKFATIPYLNSSLFEPNELEHKTIRISNLEDEHTLPVLNATVLKDKTGKRVSGSLNTLEYLFGFLDAYDFASEGSEEIQEENKTLINASVLGLIFEKINGYKDGSFFTPGFITMYMCRETIRRAVVEKFNSLNQDSWFQLIDPSLGDSTRRNSQTERSRSLNANDKKYKNIDDIYNAIGTDFTREQANEIINSLKICDPAVGSGHFLVSALNEIITVKSELKILLDKKGRTLRDYHVEVVNDELVVTDDEGRLFEYKPGSRESQRVQETLFHEKQTIIENCLFGVDINPNSVKICRLRLWIELLKNAYYKKEPAELATQSHLLSNSYSSSEQVNPSHQLTNSSPLGGGRKGALETLPNIDINIKTGNSLISRYELDADMKRALKKSRWNIDDYRLAVMTYRNAQSKEVKREMENLIDKIKNDFESEIAANDKRLLKLNKLKGELFALTNQQQLFDLSKTEKANWNKKVKKLTQDIQKLETELEEIRTNNIYENAFEWRFEFPEVLNNDGDFVGFDVVIGNPPYFQIQKLSYDLSLIKYTYKSYEQTGDIYSLFYEKGNQILNNNGFLNFITSNKWLRAKYGESLRKYLIQNTNCHLLVDFNYYQVFDEASVDTNILLFSKGQSNSIDNAVLIDYDFAIEKIDSYVKENSFLIESLNEKYWNINTLEINEIIEKIEEYGIKLSEWNLKINYGIKTGLNQAFIINEKLKRLLIEKDSRNSEIIVPYLRGRDIRRFGFSHEKLWLINSHNGIKSENIPPINVYKDYPIIHSYLRNFEENATKRADKGDHWTNLRNCAYMKDFEKEKLVYAETMRIHKNNPDNFPRFGYDDSGYYCDKTTFIATGSHLKYLLGVINSKMGAYVIKEFVTKLDTGGYMMQKVFIEEIPIPLPTKDEKITEKVTQILTLKKQNPTANISALEAEIDRMVYELYGLTAEEIAVVEGV